VLKTGFENRDMEIASPNLLIYPGKKRKLKKTPIELINRGLSL